MFQDELHVDEGRGGDALFVEEGLQGRHLLEFVEFPEVVVLVTLVVVGETLFDLLVLLGLEQVVAVDYGYKGYVHWMDGFFSLFTSDSFFSAPFNCRFNLGLRLKWSNRLMLLLFFWATMTESEVRRALPEYSLLADS